MLMLQEDEFMDHPDCMVLYLRKLAAGMENQSDRNALESIAQYVYYADAVMKKGILDATLERMEDEGNA